jgi:hypothetical protein
MSQDTGEKLLLAQSSGRLVLVAGIAAYLGGLLAFAAPFFARKVYLAQDLGAFHLPMRWFYQRSLQAGEPFDWFPLWFNGVYLSGEGQGGFFHPLNHLVYRFAPLDVAFNLELLASYVALGAGTFLFLRRWELSREAALFGGICAAFSGASLHHYMTLNVMTGYAHIPLLLVAIDAVARESRPSRVVAASLGLTTLIASQILLGHPQMIFVVGLVGGAYALLLVGQGASWWRVGRLVAAVVLGVSIGAIQILPMLDALAGSIRDTAPTGPASAVALHPFEAVQLTAPYLFKRGAIGSSALGRMTFTADLSIYAGSATSVLWVWLFVRRRQLGAQRTLLVAAGVVAVVMGVLAMGDAGGLYAVQRRLPLAGLFRTPARYGMMVDLALAVVSAIGFEQVRKAAVRGSADDRSRSWLLLLAPALSLGVVLAAWAAIDVGWRVPKLSSLSLQLVGPALVLAAAALVGIAIRGRPLALAALLVFCAADLMTYNLLYIARHDRERVEDFIAKLPVPESYGPDQRIVIAHTASVMRDVRMTMGLVAMVPRQFEILASRDEAMQPVVRNFKRISSVAWYTPWEMEPERGPLPRARVVSDARQSDHPIRDLGEVDVEKTVLVPHALDLEPGASGRAEIVSDRPGRIEVHVEATGRALLVVSESHHEGWKARIDNEPCDVVAAYGHFLGCEVRGGTQRVVFEFDATSLRRGRAISLAGLLVTLVWLAWELLRPGARQAIFGEG